MEYIQTEGDTRQRQLARTFSEPVSTDYALLKPVQNFHLLPDANKVEFTKVPPMELRVRLPNLPAELGSSSSEHKPPQEMMATPVDLMHRLLVYPPETRITAAKALKHSWFVAEGGEDTKIPVLLPKDRRSGSLLSPERDRKEVAGGVTSWNGKPLGHWLNVAFKRS